MQALRTLGVPALTLTLASIASAQCPGDDVFEDNDVCATLNGSTETDWAAIPDLGLGTYPTLVVHGDDFDYYQVSIPALFFIQIELDFDHAQGNIDAFLYDGCALGAQGLDSSTSLTDDEVLFFSNYANVPVDLVVEVTLPDGCNDYTIDVLGGFIDLFGNYCSGAPNSTGFGAMMTVSGSFDVAANNLTLYASPVPAVEPGLFYYGPVQVQVPFGDGFRCVGSGPAGIHRLPISVSNALGILSHDVDLANPPSSLGQITAGSTWNFQGWYRDPDAMGSSFNLSDGFEIHFQP